MNLKHRLIFCNYNVFTPQLIQYAHILHQIVWQKLRLILQRASQMTIDYGEGPWAPAEIFVGGGQVRKSPHICSEFFFPSLVNSKFPNELKTQVNIL